MFFVLLSEQHFYSILMVLGFQRRSLMGSIFANFADLCAEIEARKLMNFGRLLGGAGGEGRGLSSSSDSAKHGEKLHSHPAPPAGVWRILRGAPSAAGPF